jgi:hypothetical protein
MAKRKNTPMTSLPVTLVEAEAAQFARDWIRKIAAANWRDDPVLRLGCSILDPKAGHIWVRNFLKRSVMAHPFNATDIIAAARAGWEDADIALRELIAEHLDRDEQPPAQVAAYGIELLHPNRARLRGRQHADHVFQDIAIAGLILELVERFPLKPTGRSGRRPSASRIVAAAFSEARIRNLTAKAVEAIWARYLPAIGMPRFFNGLPS